MAAKAKKKKAAPQKKSFAPREKSRPLTGIVVLALGCLLAVAMVDFEPSQSSQLVAGAEGAKNLAGKIGAETSVLLLRLFGAVAWAFPPLIAWIAFLLLFKRAHRVRLRLFLSLPLFILSLTGLANLVDSWDESPRETGGVVEMTTVDPGESLASASSFPQGLGGLTGRLLCNETTLQYAGPVGNAVGLGVLTFFSGLFLFTDNIREYLRRRRERRAERAKIREKEKAARQKEKARRELEAKHAAEQAKKAAVKAAKPPSTKKAILAEDGPKGRRKPLPAGEAILGEPEPAVDDYIPEAEAFDLETEQPVEPPAPPEPVADEPPAPPSKQAPKPAKKSSRDTPIVFPQGKTTPPFKAPGAEEDKKPATRRVGGITIVQGEKVEKAAEKRPERIGDYIFPPMDLLTDPPADEGGEEHDYEELMSHLVQTLEEFNVKVAPAEVLTGPVITRYEVTPAPGVRVEKILNLDKNIALGLKADAVRIIAPVPGKGTVGVEVPNRKPKPVCMKEIVESKSWVESKAEIPVVLGKDVTGKAIVEDLTKMPHMLIAGSTGSGKTVCINAVIASLLYYTGPEDLRFIMVDPKVVEMQVYNDLPHMLIPVVTDPKKVPGALKYLINEMERRYQIFAKVGVRNIAGFNKKLTKDKEERAKLEALEREQGGDLSAEERAAAATLEVPRDDDAFEIPEKKLPYIVCVIDELADLMMVAPQDIETGVARLAQLARAAGIHLILATQRPSVNVITGVIKANLPTRISFKVASKVDSRTILDQQGAEALIGKGDMLFIPPGTSNLVRAQGAFVSDDEINHIVEFLKEKNGEPDFADEVQQQIESGGEDGSGGAESEYDDELVPQAIEIIRTHQRASTSFLQRKLKIGYNRAARIVEILEDEGVVGPDNGSSPREILIDVD